MALLQELEKYEGAFSRNYTKARIKIMKESLEPEAVEEPGNCLIFKSPPS
jgi:hypothetical protein